MMFRTSQVSQGDTRRERKRDKQTSSLSKLVFNPCNGPGCVFFLSSLKEGSTLFVSKNSWDFIKMYVSK